MVDDGDIAPILRARLAGEPLVRVAGLRDLDDGYRLQERANAELARHFGPVVGIKIGGTTAAMRHYIGAPEPVFGCVFRAHLQRGRGRAELSRYRRLGLESEIAVRLGRPLPLHAGPHRPEEMEGVVAGMMAAVELVEDRYRDFRQTGAPTIVADNAFNAGLVLGPERPPVPSAQLGRLLVRSWVNGRLVAEGRADALLGHPLQALAWLADRLAALGWRIPEGQLVSLGTVTPVQWVERPGRFAVWVEALGRAALRLV